MSGKRSRPASNGGLISSSIVRRLSGWVAFPCAQLCRAGSDDVNLFVDDADAARKRYKKDLDLIKPDLAAYNKQKELALGLAPGTLSKAGGSSSSVTQFDPKQGSSLQVGIEAIEGLPS